MRDRLQAALVNSYRIERELGGGGMSRVFVATELALDRPVVLKVLPPELVQAVSTERFRQEIRLAARLQHPHIVALLSAGEADGLLYYSMPLIEGESLRVRLAREGELPVRDAVRVLRDIAAALSYAHEHGVVHRDIKPDNVLLSGGEALVTDFGVAKALSASATGGDSGLTSLGVALGTPAYMAPEQGVADPHVDHRADIYAFGCLAYEVLTGQAPFTGRPAAALLAAHSMEAPEAVTHRRPTVPVPLALLVMRCLEKRPADRPQSAGEVLQALESIATPSGGTEPTRVTPARSRAPNTWSRRQLPWIALASAVAVGIAAIVYARREPPPTQLDANLVAVAPFDALGPGLDLWREGFVDLLSRNLDGAGPLRTVSPTVVIKRWSGRADPTSAAELGRSTGAGLAVYGSLVSAGGDSVRLQASVLDVGSGRSLGEVQLRANAHRMDELSDSLTVSLLRELGRSRPIVAVRAGALQATSLPALKAFLEGERYYRRGAWDSASVAYERTLALDSMFVPAILHAANAAWWMDPFNTTSTHRSLVYRAAALNHGLARRDSLFIVAESNFVALEGIDTLPPPVRRRLSTRLFGTLDELTRLYPNDPEIWYLAGEAILHQGWLNRSRPREGLEAMDRAIALDSSFAVAYVHTLNFGASPGSPRDWTRRARAFIASGAAGILAEDVRFLLPLLEAESATADSLIRTASNDRLVSAVSGIYQLPDSTESAIRITRALATRPAPNQNMGRLSQAYYSLNLAHRGHIRAAVRELGVVRDYPDVSHLTAELALIGAVGADTADALLADLLRRAPMFQPGVPPFGGGGGALAYAGLWWAARRDTLALTRFAARLDSAALRASGPRLAEVAEYRARSARAYLALARGDSTAALRNLTELPHDVVWSVHERLTQAKLLASQGRDSEVIELLDRTVPWGFVGPAQVLARLETARAAERLGMRERALDDYRYIPEVWRHADPELLPYVNEARAAVARLSAEGL